MCRTIKELANQLENNEEMRRQMQKDRERFVKDYCLEEGFNSDTDSDNESNSIPSALDNKGAEKRLEQALAFKEKGTEHFKEQEYEIASTWYQKVVELLEQWISLKEAAEGERKSLLQTGRLNITQCHLKMSRWTDAQLKALATRFLRRMSSL